MSVIAPLIGPALVIVFVLAFHALIVWGSRPPSEPRARFKIEYDGEDYDVSEFSDGRWAYRRAFKNVSDAEAFIERQLAFEPRYFR